MLSSQDEIKGFIKEVEIKCVKKDISVAKFMKKIKVSHSQLWKWKNGTAPTTKSIEKIKAGVREHLGD